MPIDKHMPLYQQVGFDYVQATRDLLEILTFSDLTKAIGYKKRSSVQRLLMGAVPSHERGEALFVIYREKFGRKPPLGVHQKRQMIV